MKKVYFVRHGESDSNAGGEFQGHATPLTETGRRQAEFVAERISKLEIDLIVSSLMERAKGTAEEIRKRTNKPVVHNDVFAERRSPSLFIGTKSTDSIRAAANDEIAKNFTVPGYRHSDEENFDDLKARALEALTFLSERPEHNIVVVGHGLFLRVILATVIFGHELTAHECDRFIGGARTANTGISVIEENPKWISGWRLFIFNDHAHLAE